MAKTYYMRWIAVLLLAFSTQSKADEWTKTDSGLEAAYTVLHIIDWRQTLNDYDNPRYIESNKILGEHPSENRINTYFATTLLLHAVVANYLPGKWRTAFQVVTIGVEYDAVTHNAHIGLRVNF